MLEFLFCPQHGLLRPDNLIAVLVVGEQYLTVGRLYAARVIAKFDWRKA